MPFEEERITEINFDLNDPLLQKVLSFQDRQQTDSLLTYFSHKDPTYRYASAMAFASWNDKAALSKLNSLLQDNIEEVRVAAAYAIGQIGEESSEDVLVGSFRTNDSTSSDALYNSTILEAVGKCGSPKYLKSISTVTSYRRKDTLLLQGQAWGIYRYALRGITAQEGTNRMVELLTRSGYPNQVRYIAANYLHRAENIDIDTFSLPLIQTYNQEEDPRIKMAMAIALGKTKKNEALDALLNSYNNTNDYRVKCNIIRALGNFDYLPVKELITQALDDDNIHIANTAAQFLANHGAPNEAILYMRKARDTTLHWTTQSMLFNAANKITPPFYETTIGSINANIRRKLAATENVLEKGELLKALSQYSWNYRFIKEQGFAAESPILRTKAVEALGGIAKRPDFDKFFGLGRTKVKRELATAFLEAISTGDAGMVYEAAKVLGNSQLNFKEVIESDTVMTMALSQLKLPNEIESYNELKKAINYIKGLPEEPASKPEFSHPIDWRIVNTVTETNRAIIQTSVGNITLKLFPEKAPGTVANFITLSRGGFYDKKTFHRIVPNFVVQGGCPRGDGFGSLDYTIRSELPPLNYDRAGFVGMASAGNHTECTNFFITHAPTPHLDGNYTIFAQVIDGMDVVHKIQAGTIINRITIE